MTKAAPSAEKLETSVRKTCAKERLAVSMKLFTSCEDPARSTEFLINGWTKTRPPVCGGIDPVFEPALGLRGSQEIKTAEQYHKGQESERKSGWNVVDPNPK